MLLTFIDAGFIEVCFCDESIILMPIASFYSSISIEYFQAISEVASSANTVLSIRATLLLANFISLVRSRIFLQCR